MNLRCFVCCAALVVAAGCDDRQDECAKFSRAWVSHQGNSNSSAEIEAGAAARRKALDAVASKDAKLKSLWSNQLALFQKTADFHRDYEREQNTPRKIEALQARNRKLEENTAAWQKGMAEIDAYCSGK